VAPPVRSLQDGRVIRHAGVDRAVNARRPPEGRSVAPLAGVSAATPMVPVGGRASSHKSTTAAKKEADQTAKT
jgi:hypothetical protein